MFSFLKNTHRKRENNNNKKVIKPSVLPWKPREASCCSASEKAAPSRGSWGCRFGPARRRGPRGRPPRSWCPVWTWESPGWPWSRWRLQFCCRGRMSRAAWTVWWWAALREYASQQLGSVPPNWVLWEEPNSLEEKSFLSLFVCIFFQTQLSAKMKESKAHRAWRVLDKKPTKLWRL